MADEQAWFDRATILSQGMASIEALLEAIDDGRLLEASHPDQEARDKQDRAITLIDLAKEKIETVRERIGGF